MSASLLGKQAIAATRQSKSELNVNQTPQKRSGSSHSSTSYRVKDLQDLMRVELSGSIQDFGHYTELFPTLAHRNNDIIEFLRNSPLYDCQSGTWNNLRDKPALEKHLYPHFNEVFQAVKDHFGNEFVSRWITETHGKTLAHKRAVVYHDTEDKVVKPKSAPDFCVLGAGPLFPGSNNVQPPAEYLNCVSPIEIKRHADLNMTSVTLQVAIYARQCFEFQASRDRVVCLVITEKVGYVFVYDRSGAMRTSSFDIHANAMDFVRVILGIGSRHAHLVGLDDRVAFRPDGSQTLTFKNRCNPSDPADRTPRTTTYVLIRLLCHRMAITGRGTVCYVAHEVGKPNNILVIKNSWRQHGRPAEYKLLRKFTGIRGVGQMIGYENERSKCISAGRATIIGDYPTDFPSRGPGSNVELEYESSDEEVEEGQSDDDSDRDEGFEEGDEEDDEDSGSDEEHTQDYAGNNNNERHFSSLVLEAYGNLIEEFDTPLQLLYTFRDAVAGHMNLWREGYLHRDVSANNVVHGLPNADLGDRGKLIDFDMAISIFRRMNKTKGHRTGTRAFQSSTLLGGEGHCQDHLDDLESFFYVLAWVCCKFDGPGNPIADTPRIVIFMENKHDELASSSKEKFLRTQKTHLTPYFAQSPIFVNLLKVLGDFCRDVIDEKSARHDRPSIRQIHRRDNNLPSTRNAHHKKYLELIDNAIAAQEELMASFPSPNNAAGPHSSPLAFQAPVAAGGGTSSGSHHKRQRNTSPGTGTGTSSKRSKKD